MGLEIERTIIPGEVVRKNMALKVFKTSSASKNNDKNDNHSQQNSYKNDHNKVDKNKDAESFLGAEVKLSPELIIQTHGKQINITNYKTSIEKYTQVKPETSNFNKKA